MAAEELKIEKKHLVYDANGNLVLLTEDGGHLYLNPLMDRLEAAS